jgi:hypothetical protein
LSAVVALPAKTRARSRTSCVRTRRTFVLFVNITTPPRPSWLWVGASSLDIYNLYLIYNIYNCMLRVKAKSQDATPEHPVKGDELCILKCSGRRCSSD